MYLLKNIILLTCIHTYHCNMAANRVFENINAKTLTFNQISAELAWKSSINTNIKTLNVQAANYQKNRIIWQQSTCDHLATLFRGHLLNRTQERQTYLLCRGPKFTFQEARETSSLYTQLQEIYNAQICFPNIHNIPVDNVSGKQLVIQTYLSSLKSINPFFYEIPSKTMSLISKNQKLLLSTNKTKDAESNFCLNGEIDFDELMASSRSEEVLRWVWTVWREITGPIMKEPYKRLVDIENMAARRNGYRDIGSSWRDELEIPNLRTFCRELYENVRPLYVLLHGVVRFHLRKLYGELVPERGPIPAHLLGNLWSQNWEHLSDLIIKEDINLDINIKKMNWSVTHMVKRAEDYYQSLGLPAMTGSFWNNSVFSRENNAAKCHGAAADMFKDGDFRLLYCSRLTKEDFYVLHHEFGHIQYFMAYENQPALFRQANTALHEAIGDTIMYGVMTPQHLHRLGLLTDKQLYSTNTIDSKENQNSNDVPFHSKFKPYEFIKGIDSKLEHLNFKNINEQYNEDIEGWSNEPTNFNNKFEKVNGDNILNKRTELYKKMMKYHYNTQTDIKMNLKTDEILLLKQALNKIPQIPFSLLMDEYRWKYFEGALENVNDDFWKLSLDLQGISPPGLRGEEYFDAGAKFHVPDNTPYIRYFLSSFLQHQLFESLCKTAVFGRRYANEPLPKTIALHRCDLYGSKAVGKVLKDIMSRGHSEHWKEILQSTVNISDISSSALKRYYRPLQRLLIEHVQKYNIPIGW